MNEPEVSTFHAVRAAELAAIAERRTVHPRDGAPEIERSLTGLALSGGGVRSATFSLGVLQALHEQGHLAKFDYLSTVSGGGFTGAWWTTWLSRTEFLASHVHDADALATRLMADVAPAVAQPIAAARSAAANGEGRQRLVDVLVETLNSLRTGQTADAIFARYEPALTRLFPANERVEPERAADYRNPTMPDGALAAGADPIHHIRLFANYLTPRKGLMSIDTWRAAAVVSRNLIFTWCVLVPILLAVVLTAQLYFVVQPFDASVTAAFLGHPADATLWDRALVAARLPIALGVAIVVVALLWIGFNHAGTRWTHATAMIGGTLIVAGAFLLWRRPGACDGIVACVGAVLTASTGAASRQPPLWDYVFVALIVLGVALIASHIVRGPQAPTGPAVADVHTRPWYRPSSVLGALLAIFIGPEYVQRVRDAVQRQVGGNQATRWHGTLLMWLVLATVTLAFAGFAHEGLASLLDTDWGRIELGKTIAAVAAAAAAAGSIFTALKGSPAAGQDVRATAAPTLPSRIVFALTPPLVLLVLAAAMAWAGQRVLATVTHDAHWPVVLPFFSVMGLIGVVIALVYGALEVMDSAPAPWTRQRFAWTLALGAAAGLTAWSVHPVRGADACPTGWWPAVLGAMSAFALVTIASIWTWVHRTFGRRRRRPLVLFGFSGAAMILVLVGSVTVWCAASLAMRAAYAGFLLLLVVLAWIFTVGWMSDPNALGLHTFYKARLVRAYLGASNPARHHARRDIHDSVVGDDVRLSALAPTRAGGPYPLINTTLNLVGGRDLVTAQRSAACFLLSPRFCGSVRTGYRPTTDYMGGQLSVGAAVATSGAAASPNMGSRTPSAALAMLLTLFNVRLGLWAPTPHKAHWAFAQARLWPFYLLRESLSQTNDLGSYCYLTDGGHFDNTGLYSLVERGCRTIVLVDNGADPTPAFEDVGEAMRRCRIDFGADIDLKVTGFQRTETAGAHYAVGKIRYGAAHLRELGLTGPLEGDIVWIKPTVVGGEPADVVQYKIQNVVFPQQSTRDQWFDEAQFESYRQLGIASVRAVLAQHPRILG